VTPSVLVDDQLPPALTHYLKSLGYDAAHVRDIGLGGKPDDAIGAAAERLGAILVTKDQDFVIRSNLGKLSCPVFWIRLGNMGNRALRARLNQTLARCIAAFEAGEKIVELS
jgi:predicted nuclease of predicted toxin-antitoxin system